eukprot:TRINITY_DN12332_c0_g2_i1.p1 TRINITY_DN12332_c0_g2~~TRINITY_DN12332_c0_g2_i1.p1  ORF type:complete len:364 (-),score=48.75 TRINITY_DN12332_c0_g2_i1:184-1251(-)
MHSSTNLESVTPQKMKQEQFWDAVLDVLFANNPNWPDSPEASALLLGEGASGMVFKWPYRIQQAFDKKSDPQIWLSDTVVKICKSTTEDYTSEARQQQRISKELGESRIAQVHWVTKIFDRSCIIMQHVPGETVEQIARGCSRTSRSLPPFVRREWGDSGDNCIHRVLSAGLHALECLRELHETMHLLHADLHSENVLFTASRGYIIDFGKTRYWPTHKESLGERNQLVGHIQSLLGAATGYVGAKGIDYTWRDVDTAKYFEAVHELLAHLSTIDHWGLFLAEYKALLPPGKELELKLKSEKVLKKWEEIAVSSNKPFYWKAERVRNQTGPKKPDERDDIWQDCLDTQGIEDSAL